MSEAAGVVPLPITATETPQPTAASMPDNRHHDDARKKSGGGGLFACLCSGPGSSDAEEQTGPPHTTTADADPVETSVVLTAAASVGHATKDSTPTTRPEVDADAIDTEPIDEDTVTIHMPAEIISAEVITPAAANDTTQVADEDEADHLYLASLRNFLRASGLFNGIEVPLAAADLHGLLRVGGEHVRTVELCAALDEVQKRFASVPDLTAALKQLLAIEAEAPECLAFLKNTEVCRLWSTVEPAGQLQEAIGINDIHHLYEHTHLGTNTLAIIKQLVDHNHQLTTFHNLIAVLQELTSDTPTPAAVHSPTLLSIAEDDDEDHDEVCDLPENASDVEPSVERDADFRVELISPSTRNTAAADEGPPSSSRRSQGRSSADWTHASVADQLIEQADHAIFDEDANIRIRCKNLMHVGKFSQSRVVIKFSRERAHIWESTALSEAVKNDLSPTFEPFMVNLQKLCHGQLNRKIKIEALETDAGIDPLLIGHIITTPNEIMARGPSHEWELFDPAKERMNPARDRSRNYKNSGTLFFTDFRVMVNASRGSLNCPRGARLFDDTTEDRLKIQMGGKNLDRMDRFGKSDPYCIFYLADSHGRKKEWKEVHRTEIVMNTLNPVWKPFVKTVAEFCDFDLDRRIRVKIWDWDNVGEHDFMGQFDMTVRGMLEKAKYRVVNEERAKSDPKYKHSGSVSFKSARYYTTVQDVDREAEAELIKQRAEPSQVAEYEVDASLKRRAFLAFLATKPKTLVKARSSTLLRHSSDESANESYRAHNAAQNEELAMECMSTGLLSFKRAALADETVSIILRGEGLPKLDLLSSDPFVEFFKLAPDSTLDLEAGELGMPDDWVLVARSEVLKSAVNPKWPAILVKSAELITDLARADEPAANRLLVRASDWNSDGSVDEMGSFLTSYPELRKCKETRHTLMWVDPKHPSKGTKQRGTIIVESCKAALIRLEQQQATTMPCRRLHDGAVCMALR